MTRNELAKALLGASVALSLSGGCGARYMQHYRAAIIENQQALDRLQLGMSASAVREAMGNGDVIHYKSINFVDPWRFESFQRTDGTDVLILFYQTQLARQSSRPDDRDLTPIVLENDKLMGWGWSYVRRNTDRYGVVAPREQR